MNWSSLTVKYLLFAFNLLFVICGLVLICIGVAIKGKFQEYENLLDDRFLSAPSLLITTGSLIFFIAFFGCCGAVKENHCMVVTFSVLVGAIFVLEIVASATGYILSEETRGLVSVTLKKSMYFYPNSTDTNKLWDKMQEQMKCCGTNNYTDWHDIFENDSLPMSCCLTQYGAIGQINCSTKNLSNVFSKPCLDLLGESVRVNVGTVGIVATCVALVEMFGVALACYLANSIKSKNYESV